LSLTPGRTKPGIIYLLIRSAHLKVDCFASTHFAPVHYVK